MFFRKIGIWLLFFVFVASCFLIWFGAQKYNQKKDFLKPNEVIQEGGSEETKTGEGFTEKIATEPTVLTRKKRFEEAISKTIEGVEEKYGLYIKDLNSDYKFSFGGDQVFYAASLIKIPIILEFYRQRGAGNITPETAIEIIDADFQEGESFPEVGKIYLARELARIMIKESNNTAAAALARTLGWSNIVALKEILRASNTNLTDNTSTASDMGKFLEAFFDPQVVRPELLDEVIELMHKTYFEDLIPYPLPEEIKVSHKVGIFEGIYSDAGIVFGKKSKYILVIMDEDVSQIEARDLIRKISEITFNYFENN